MPRTVGARVPADALKHAAIGLGLSPDASKSGVIRGALALFHGLDPQRFIEPPRKPVGRGVTTTRANVIDVAIEAPAELAEMPPGVKRATAIRVGLAMATGWSREDAQAWAESLARGLYAKRNADTAG